MKNVKKLQRRLDNMEDCLIPFKHPQLKRDAISIRGGREPSVDLRKGIIQHPLRLILSAIKQPFITLLPN